MNSESTIKIGLVGAGGRAGKEVIKTLANYPGFALSAAIVSSRNPELGKVVPGIAPELVYSTDFNAAKVDIWIDFSTPEGSLALLRATAGSSVPVLVLTTGNEHGFHKLLKQRSEHAPVMLCSNSSLGVFALGQLAKRAKEILGERFQVEILDLHHKAKRDAPSGTALSLGRELATLTGDQLAYGPDSRNGARADNEIGIASLRGGDAVGEHTIYFLGDGERLELTHRATDRSIFARGALTLASKLCAKPPGIYQISDMF